MSRSNFYNNYYQSFMNENMNPLYRRYLEYLSSDLPDVSDIGGFIDVPTTAEREGLESLLDTTEDVRIPLGPMAPMNQQREGGGGPRTGKFGNLDPASERMVLIDGVPTRVYTDASGLLKTFDGRNVKGEVNTQTGAFDYEADAYGIPSIYGASFPPSLSSEFSLDKQRAKAIQNQTVYEQKLAAEKKAKEEAERKAKREAEIERAQRAEVERIRQENERLDKGGYQSDFKQDKNFMEGEGRGRGNDPDDKGGSDTMGSF
tara:strand:+ start:1479 stop:2258 length:780 start_codon:yes stop_codon:yes gene_type:complete